LTAFELLQGAGSSQVNPGGSTWHAGGSSHQQANEFGILHSRKSLASCDRKIIQKVKKSRSDLVSSWVVYYVLSQDVKLFLDECSS